LARTYGAGLVALTIDEEGMAKTADRKLAVARRIHDIVVGRWGLPPDAILFDPLTFTIGSGDEDSRKAGIETLDAIAAIKRELPGVRTLLGLSNISFGLKPYTRQILNSVYLAEAIERGLDSAILNAAKIIPLSKLSQEEISLTRDLIYDRRREGYDPLFKFIEHFESAAQVQGGGGVDESSLPVEERLKKRIIDGKKLGIDKPLDEAMQKYKPLEIINSILLDGMKTVGELFGSGQMQLPFVLQSAETMKTAVAHLEPHMEKSAGSEKGVIVLATVKGDVHDIGKNLVDIILSNNGYRVINLGIKQPIDSILTEAESNKADAVGMSGLLVKSTVVMKENLELMSGRGLTIPVICGGAALNRGYVEGALSAAYPTGEVYYGQDAFTGLKLMDELCGHQKDRVLTGPGRKRAKARFESREDQEQKALAASHKYVKSDIGPAPRIPTPPFFGSRVVTAAEIKLDEVFPYINKRALFRGQWQYRRGRRAEHEYRHFISEVVEPKFHQWCQRAVEKKWLEPAVVYGYFKCRSHENSLTVEYTENGGGEVKFDFPRQPEGRHLCLADFFRPEGDIVCFQLVSMGKRASEICDELFKANRYDDYLHFHGLAVETAEALAEVWHARVRHELNIGINDSPTIEQLFNQAYQGSRYSFGYPACPRLEDQRQVFTLLEPERVGMSLSEEFQLVPEQATSALIVHHPEARYFSILGD
jgi:5-methyltetrahydrofolate--homocysteine methyltransferase